ncbi:MAG: glycosyltransferase family 2 protein [Thalassovita sp.]
MAKPRWGIVSTIKAPLQDIQNFCAHHLELGAHRIYLYLDDPDQDGVDSLKAHPALRVRLCTEQFWARRNRQRPKKHQNRQVANAAHAYRRRIEVDWLIHIDADEFLWPQTPLHKQLAALPADCLVARVRPSEALANPVPSETTHFKRLTLKRPERDRQAAEIYPNFGAYLNGGFLSHVQGKLFYRTGVDGLKAKIHNVLLGDDMNPRQVELSGTELLHMHAKSWPDFLASFHFRLNSGSYRSELKALQGGLSMHQLFSSIYEDGGDDGLRKFYDEVCTATPELLTRLRAHDLLSSHDLALDEKRVLHFAHPHPPQHS